MTLQFCLYRTAATLAVLIIGATAELVSAADSTYPTRPIRVVVSNAPGGGIDAAARILAPKLTDSMGQPWIIDNRAGAAGNVGAEIVARANPDGYTALIATSTLLTVNPSLYKMPFSVQRDLQPVMVLGSGEQVVVVHPSVPAKTLQELISLAKKKPGALNYGSAGVGTAIHLGAELLNIRAGIDMKEVPYKGGGPAAAALISGEVQVLVGTVASTISFLQAGRLRALATTGAKRSKAAAESAHRGRVGLPGVRGKRVVRAARSGGHAETHSGAHAQRDREGAPAARRASRHGAPGPRARAEHARRARRAYQE